MEEILLENVIDYDYVKESEELENQYIIDKYLSRYDDETGPWYWEKE